MATGDSGLTLTQAVVAASGETSLTLTQLVKARGDSGMTLAQTVAHPSGSTTLTLTQAVGAGGAVSMALTQNVFSPAVVAGSWVDWDIKVMVGGVDVSSSLTGTINIDIERSAARLADFTVVLSGTITPAAWTGKPVTIDYQPTGGAKWRRFTGVVMRPVLDLARKTLRCMCTDDLQRIVDNHTNEQIAALIPGARWSKHVFSGDQKGWRYAQDLLATVSLSLEQDSHGTLKASSLQAKASADFTFDQNLVVDDSLTVDLLERGNLINRVDLTFAARFERFWHREERIYWTNGPASFCGYIADPYQLPNRSMVEQAVTSASRQILDVDYDDLWPSGGYACGGGVIPYTNNYPEAIIGFKLTAAFRWSQSITHEYKLTVKSDTSIAAFGGEYKDTASYAADFQPAVDNWADTSTNYAAGVSTFARDAERDRYQDQYTAGELTDAMNAAVAIAVEQIYKTHRGTTVSFKTPAAPYLELRHTVAVSDGDISAKGVVNRIKETYNLDKGEALSAVDLLVSSGDVGVETITPTWVLPAAPVETPPDSPGWYSIESIPMHIGGRLSSPAPSADWDGFITNYFYITESVSTVTSAMDIAAGRYDYNPTVTPYPVEMRLKFNAVNDAKSQNKTVTITQDVIVTVPNNVLTMVA